tara:strand:+ start:10577 stop:10891 length:315 start_codon:yes stop_codon:yes gene_type:complete
MNEKLAVSLIEKNIISVDTEIDGLYWTQEFGGANFQKVGTFGIDKIEKINGKYVFNCRSTNDGQQEWMVLKDVVKVDGMEPTKLAKAYNLDENGQKPKKKRKKK